MTRRPRIALTCGEPAGIGPELALPAWEALRGEMDLLWIGNPAHLPQGTPWREASPDEPASPKALAVLSLDIPGPRTPGAPDPNQAHGVITAIDTAVSLALRGHVDALCTAPIHKAALQKGAGFAHPGHTEYLAALAGLPPEASVMMLACDTLRVVPVTIHIALAEVPPALTPERLTHVIETTHAALRTDFGITAPRLAVAGLNPHAGESGKMGREEVELIAPALDLLRAKGLDLVGPLSADTMFHGPARARYDAAICMYHDQALIPIKTLDFSGGVNVTLGLPFVRTSPDHGTAFDIAGTGQADPTSTIAALRMAAQIARQRAV